VSALLPYFALVKRELVRDLRRVRPFLVLVIILCIAFTVVLTNYPPSVMSPNQIAEYSSIMFGGMSAVLFLACLLILPAFASTTIVLEREQDTFDLLSLTLTRPTMLLLAKVTSSLGYFGLLIIAMLPLLGVSYFLVGIDVRTVALVAVHLLVVSLTCVCAGVMSSTLARSTQRAVSLGFASAFMLLIGYVIPFGILSAFVEFQGWQWIASATRGVLVFLLSLSPVNLSGAFMIGIGGRYSIVNMIVGQGVFCVLALLLARRMILRASAERSFTTVPIPMPMLAPPPLPESERGSPTPGEDWLPAWPPVPDNVNPVYARERLHVRLTQQLTPLRMIGGLLIVIPVMIIMAMAMSGMDPRPSEAKGIVTTWMIGLALLSSAAGVSSSATAWSREFERDTADLLRSSRLTPSQLVTGKVRAACASTALPLGIAVVASLPIIPLIFFSPAAILQFVVGVISLVVVTVECVAVGTVMSMFSRRSAACLVYASGGMAAILGAPFVVFTIERFLFFLLGFNFFDGEPLRYWFLSPIVSYARCIGWSNIDPIWTYGTWFLAMLFHLGVAYSLVRVATLAFSRWHMQER